MATATLLRPGARLWSPDGLTATVTAHGPAGVLARIDGEHQPQPVSGAWRLATPCDYCDHPAEVQLRDGQPGDVLCKRCAHDQSDRPADWVRPIPRTVIRQLYRSCRRLR
jgi:hypothetical protein